MLISLLALGIACWALARTFSRAPLVRDDLIMRGGPPTAAPSDDRAPHQT